jgi:HEPN domain-containing protein
LTPSDLQIRRTNSFLLIAERELRAASHLGVELPEQAAYFVQQAVEKLIRALLELEGIPMGVGHNLRALADQLPQDHSFAGRFRQFDDLSVASTRYRYPTSEGRLLNFDPRQLPPLLAAVSQLNDEINKFVTSQLSRQ